MISEVRQARSLHRQSLALQSRWLAFLSDCIAEADRRHTPDQVAAAAAYLATDTRARQSPFDLPRQIGE